MVGGQVRASRRESRWLYRASRGGMGWWRAGRGVLDAGCSHAVSGGRVTGEMARGPGRSVRKGACTCRAAPATRGLWGPLPWVGTGFPPAPAACAA